MRLGTSSPEWDRFKELCGAAASVGPGARHIKVEFHCHTPASDDFEVRGAEGYDALAANIAAQNLDAVFVTDHNTWEGIGQLTEAVQKSGGRARVVLLPFSGSSATFRPVGEADRDPSNQQFPEY